MMDKTPKQSAADTDFVLLNLEQEQLAEVRSRRLGRRHLRPYELALMWLLRVYLLFMVGVVIYQVYLAARGGK